MQRQRSAAGQAGTATCWLKSSYVAVFIRQLSEPIRNDGGGLGAASVEQHLVGLRSLFDWLVVGQVLPSNPVAAVRGTKRSLSTGKTPILEEDDAKWLLTSIAILKRDGTPDIVGLRDRVLIATMIDTFGRDSSVTGRCIGDDFPAPNGERYRVRPKEKNGRDHEMPAHDKLNEYLAQYLTEVPFASDAKRPLFPSSPGRGRGLTDRAMDRSAAYRMVRRRAKTAGIAIPIGNHSFRGSGITNYLRNGGRVEEAQRMAAHADPRTTKLYDRTGDEVSLDEVRRITI